MAKFLNRFGSTDALKKIILEADRQLILISPYIKLNQDLKNALNTHLHKPELELIVVYGKNEEDNRKSISDDDYKYFQSFSNISIRYHKRLHAKMYANDKQCLTTSMNLHNYSLKENIETGILTEFKFIDLASSLLSMVAPNFFKDPLDTQAMDFVEYIVSKSVAQFERKGKKENSMFGLFNSYSEGEISIDKSRTGFCIRTAKPIPFNPGRPMCKEAYDSWVQYKNPDFKEKFCHKTGKPSGGKTSIRNPILL